MFSVYLVGPLIGAVGAGLFSWAHRCMLTFVDAEASFGDDAVGLAAHREAANKENHEASAENNA